MKANRRRFRNRLARIMRRFARLVDPVPIVDDDPYSQIMWGWGYIRGTYGS